MSRSFSRPLLGLLLIALLPLSAWAQDAGGDEAEDRLGYVEFRAGGASFATADLTGTGFSKAVDFDKVGYVVGGAAGFYFELADQSFRAEIDLSYRDVQANEIDGLGGAKGTLEMFAAMVNAYYDFDLEMVGLDLPIEPYVGFGLGVGVPDPDFQVGSAVSVRDDTVDFAWNVMAGFSGPLSEVLDWNLGYRYIGMDEPSFDGTVGGTPTDLDLEIAGHEILFGVRLPF